MYRLLFRNNGVLENTSVRLQMNGTSATTLDVQARATGAPPRPWSTVSNAPGTSQNRQSTANSPTNGDTLSMPSQLLNVSNITGKDTFTQHGDGSNGPGYYTDREPEEEEGGWCAAAG